MINWHTLDEKPTNEKAQYLLIVETGSHRKIYQLGYYADSYYKVDKYDFKKSDGGGFYELDPEWGHVKISDVLLWSELQQIPSCFEPIE